MACGECLWCGYMGNDISCPRCGHRMASDEPYVKEGLYDEEMDEVYEPDIEEPKKGE